MSLQYLPTTTPEQRGMLRAATEGVQVRRLHGSTWQASSVSNPGTVHLVIASRCDCLGYARHQSCKHVAAVLMAADAAHVCEHCGSEHAERGTDGRYFCVDRVQCWARWDRAHGL